MNPQYNKLQQVFCLSEIAGSAFGSKGSVEKLQSIAKQKITAILADDEIQGLIGPWELVWGPVVFQAKDSDEADNTMYVARRRIAGSLSNEVVVAIAGTNPMSWFGWLVEDFMLSPLVPWPYTDKSWAGTPQITQGTSIGLGILMGMVSDGQSLFAYLGGLTEGGSPVDVSVTGHSLGGTLSSVLGLALVDKQGTTDGKEAWDPKRRAVVSTLPSAGPAPGDADFAQYFIERIGTRTNRVWNAIDVVPNSWQINQLEAASHFYYPYIAPNLLVQTFLALGVVNSRHAGELKQVNPQTPGLPGQVNFSLIFTAESPLAQIEIALVNSIIAKIGKELGLNQLIIELIQKYVDERLTHMKHRLHKEGHTILGEILHAESLLRKGLENIEIRGLRHDLAKEVNGLLTYFFQAGWQHTSAYAELLGTHDFARISTGVTV